jgi:lipopolysaccharide/colanic/teichoic acid biosynthesis glycosyltransferase
VIYGLTKRLTDIVLSTVAICVSAPAMLAIAVWIKMDSTGPVLYRGARAGRDGRVFHILKFRSMVADAESKGGFSTATDDRRLTKAGRFLRKFKLDELPQFFNVLSGDMSLVGPRPQVLFYTDQYTGDERLILTVKPGITDLATLYFADMDTVLGSGDVDLRYRNEIEPVKNELRIRYVRERSYVLDLRILVETFFRLMGIHSATGLNVSPRETGSHG